MIWHNSSINDALSGLGTDGKNGLSSDTVSQRLAKYGLNQLEEKKKKGIVARYIDQFKDFMVIILIIAAAISTALAVIEIINGGHGEFIEPIAIIAIVLINAVIGVIQEGKAEQALEALKKLSVPRAKVIRDGVLKQVNSNELVPGDIVVVEAGDFIPADGRIIESVSLKIEESALTGESVPVEKDYTLVLDEEMPLADRKNMVFSGCSVVYGRGKYVITDTGMKTEVGKIATMLQSQEEGSTPLKEKLARLGKSLGILALVICAFVFIEGLITKGLNLDNIKEMFIFSVSLAVAAIPEGLPAIVTIVLAVGVQRMVKKNAIVRRLPAVETLGSASVICTDKTGTLTQNRMTLVKAFADNEIYDVSEENNEKLRPLLKLASLCCDGRVEEAGGEVKLIGDPTETSIVYAAHKAGLADIYEKYPRLCEIPFDSVRKMMTTVHEIDGKIIAVVKGAPDIMFTKCMEGNIEAAVKANEEMAGSAIRVLAVAVKELTEVPANPSSEEVECGLTLIGLVGMIDPPREEVSGAVKECIKAGIKPVMITGDNVLTATAIGKQIGIFKEGDLSVTGIELSQMSDDELFEKVEKISVYARVSPEDKIRIVKCWQRKGHIVAMTGDGVNDAPALKGADIGCAMGITGTDVAKGASDMVLTDDNFATLVVAVREGRGIYKNIKKAIQFLLGSNISEILTVFIAMLVYEASPVTAIQILCVNLVTDSLPALALGMEPVDKDVMDEKPRPKNEGVFARGMGLQIVLHGIMLTALTLSAFVIGYAGNEANLEVAETMTFTVLAMTQLFNAFNVRSQHSLFEVGLLSNKYMIGAFLASAGILAMIHFTPVKVIFDVAPLTLQQWGIVLALSFAPIVIVELVKLVSRVLKRKKVS